MLLNGVNLDSMISEIKPSTQKIGFSKTRSLSGKLWIDYLSISKKWDLVFEMITQNERDTLYNIYSSNNTMTFVNELGQSYTVAVTSENFDDNITVIHNGNLLYNINLTIEQV